MKTLKQNWSLDLSFYKWKKHVPSTFVFLTLCNFSLMSITLKDIYNFILDCSVNILVFLLHRNLPALPRRCGCCSKCCYQPGLSGWPFLLSDTHNPTRTSLWRARPCSVLASNRLLWSHPGCSECWKTGRFICICTNPTNKLTAHDNSGLTNKGFLMSSAPFEDFVTSSPKFELSDSWTFRSWTAFEDMTKCISSQMYILKQVFLLDSKAFF